MNVHKSLDKISSFLIDPHNKSRSAPVKGAAWACTIILGIVSIGTAQGVSALWRAKRNITQNDTHKLINKKFQQIFSKNHSPSKNLFKIFLINNLSRYVLAIKTTTEPTENTERGLHLHSTDTFY